MDDRYRAEMQAILAQFRQAIRREGNLPLFDHAAKQRIGDRIGKATLCLAFLLYRLPSPFGAQERAGKSIDFRLGQRVLFRYRARPASWLSVRSSGIHGPNRGGFCIK
jgi:hypothetical protein